MELGGGDVPPLVTRYERKPIVSKEPIVSKGIHPRSGMLRTVLGLGAALAMPSAAFALTPPQPINFQVGPWTLALTGGVDGYGYTLTGTGDPGTPGLIGTKDTGMEFLNGLVQVQKSDGLLQFTLEGGSSTSFSLGTKPTQTSIQTFSTGPLYEGALTLAPTSNFSISAGHLASLEGYESTVDWNNYNLLSTSIFYVQNSQSTGVSGTYTKGPVSATLEFSDGFDTLVFNFLQAAGTYTINDTNSVTLYGATNLGHTSLDAHAYGSATTPWWKSTVGSYGVQYVNSSMIGGYYSYTRGNLNIVPEVQYVFARQDDSLVVSGSPAMTGFSSNFGAAVFANYQFGKSPYSLGGWVEYFASNGPDNWFLNPGAKGFGISLTPTWQSKYIFARGAIGWLHLTNIGDGNSPIFSGGYGSGASGHDQATFALETGVLF